jgi:hypothetical protein
LHRGPGLASGEAAGKAVSADALLTKAATINAANEVSFFIVVLSIVWIFARSTTMRQKRLKWLAT